MADYAKWQSLSRDSLCHTLFMDQPTSLKERKKQRTRQDLIAAGRRLFAERGYDAVTVAEIAAMAEVAPRTFHRYFPDKAELVFSVYEDEINDALERALGAQPASASPDDVIRAALAAVSQLVADDHDEAVVRERVINEVPAVRARALAKGAAQQELIADHLAQRLGVEVDHDLRPRWWAGVGYATWIAAYQAWLVQGGDLSALVNEAAALLDAARNTKPHTSRTSSRTRDDAPRQGRGST
jgi:AcrR family transcriptional regulator